jgi:predicted metal-binding membrane protein
MTKSMSRTTKRKKGTGKMDAAMMIAEAKRMNREMLVAEFRGPGDTIEAAAYRQQTKWGVPVSTALRLWNREVTDMLLSSFAPVFSAYLEFKDRAEAAAQRMEQSYEKKRDSAGNPRILRLADFVAGRRGEKGGNSQ